MSTWEQQEAVRSTASLLPCKAEDAIVPEVCRAFGAAAATQLQALCQSSLQSESQMPQMMHKRVESCLGIAMSKLVSLRKTQW